MNNKVNLEALYKIEEISTYKEGERSWDDSGFSFTFKVEGKIGKLTISASDISIDADKIKRTKKDIEASSGDFFLLLKFLSCELNLVCTKEYLKLLHKDSSYDIPSDSDIELAIRRINGEKVQSYSEFIICCPQVVAELNHSKIDLPIFCTFDEKSKRNLFTFLQSKELGNLSKNYHDDMLKRWFLILDEIETDRGNADFAKIMNVRNFVSHHFCDKKEVVKLIKKELPNAICTEGEKDVARFDRQNTEHINFVQKYERLAEERVKYLLNKKIAKNCC